MDPIRRAVSSNQRIGQIMDITPQQYAEALRIVKAYTPRPFVRQEPSEAEIAYRKEHGRGAIADDHIVDKSPW